MSVSVRACSVLHLDVAAFRRGVGFLVPVSMVIFMVALSVLSWKVSRLFYQQRVGDISICVTSGKRSARLLAGNIASMYQLCYFHVLLWAVMTSGMHQQDHGGDGVHSFYKHGPMQKSYHIRQHMLPKMVFLPGCERGSKWDADPLQAFPKGAAWAMLRSTVPWQDGVVIILSVVCSRY